MSKIMELADRWVRKSHSPVSSIARDELKAEVTRMEEQAREKHEYEEAAEFYAECGPNPNSLKNWIIDTKAKLATLEAEKAELEKQEPVAWGLHRNDGLILDVICHEEHESHEGDYTVPLYLSAGAQPREPITKDEMADMFKAVGIDGYDEREKLVRAVEAHHKIGAKE